MGKSSVPQKLLTFLLNDQEYGIDLECVKEIIRWRPLTNLPDSPEYITGVVNLRGSIIPVMDLNLRVNHKPISITPHSIIIIIPLGTKRAGLIASSATNILNVEEGDIIENFSHRDSNTVYQMFHNKERALTVLDLESINRDFYNTPPALQERRGAVNE